MCRGESRLDLALDWKGAKSAKKMYKITVLRNEVGVFLRKIVVH